MYKAFQKKESIVKIQLFRQMLNFRFSKKSYKVNGQQPRQNLPRNLEFVSRLQRPNERCHECKGIARCYLRDRSLRLDYQILIESLHLGTTRMKRKRETDGTFLLCGVYTTCDCFFMVPINQSCGRVSFQKGKFDYAFAKRLVR